MAVLNVTRNERLLYMILFSGVVLWIRTAAPYHTFEYISWSLADYQSGAPFFQKSFGKKSQNKQHQPVSKTIPQESLRLFPRVLDYSFCRYPEKSLQLDGVGYFDSGMLFTRQGTLDSTTDNAVVGIQVRIAQKIAQRQRYQLNDEGGMGILNSEGHLLFCPVRRTTSFSTAKLAGKEYNPFYNESQVFLWSILQKPGEIYLDNLTLLQDTGNATVSNPLNNLQNDSITAGEKEEIRQQVQSPTQSILNKNILWRSNFLGVSERFEESIVLLAMVLRIPLGDVLFLTDSAAGGQNQPPTTCNSMDSYNKDFSAPAGHKKRTLEEANSRQNEQIQEFLLYQAANASLDWTIEKVVGRSTFNAALKRYRLAREVAKRKCHELPCHGHKERSEYETDCLWETLECRFACLDQVAEEMGVISLS